MKQVTDTPHRSTAQMKKRTMTKMLLTPAVGGNVKRLLLPGQVCHPDTPITVLSTPVLTLSLTASMRESSRAATSEVSESDQDTYGGQRGRTFAKKHRQKLQGIASGSGTPQLGEVRFSSRRAAKVATYNEDENFDNFEEEDDTENLTPNYWTYAEEDHTPSIDAILNHRVIEGIGAQTESMPSVHSTDHATDKDIPDKHDYEFHVSLQQHPTCACCALT